MKPAFSTLEVDIRGPHSTLEVDPRQYPADLEVKPADLKSPSDLAGEEQQPSDTGPTRSYTDPWYKRYWLAILVLSIIVTGGIIGGAIGGTLASKKDSKSDNNIGEHRSYHDNTITDCNYNYHHRTYGHYYGTIYDQANLYTQPG
ncbi:hypothetical protein FSHL1_011363 [Fusarium sambucinum]